MKAKLKVALCALLLVFAALSLAAVLGSLGVLPAAAAEESAYMLREYDGYIGVFYPAESETPTNLTDIRVRDLPLSDRLELAAGIGAADYGQVVRLLEDFGS